MIFLLDDPAHQVRLALAEELADCPHAPRAVILPLAEDQPEVAARVLLRSPVLADGDLVDIAAKGNGVTRMLIAHRAFVSRPVSAALAEIGEEAETMVLLENPGAILSRSSLARLAERFADHGEIRALLLGRDDLSGDARSLLIEKVGEALAGLDLVRATIGSGRVERVMREACDVATLVMAGEAPEADMPALVEHLRVNGRLTPVFLMHALCTGRAEFFATAIVNLSGHQERRVRALLSDGREAALRALYETCGLGGEIAGLFAQATLIRRRGTAADDAAFSVSERLLAEARGRDDAACQSLLELVERLALAEQRRTARSYAMLVTREAA